MADSQTIDAGMIQQFLAENHNATTVSEKLHALGWDKELIMKYISEFKRLKNARRQTLGTVYMVAGGLIGFLSCVLAIVDPIPELYNWFLFGLTSVAILLACYGLYNFFE